MDGTSGFGSGFVTNLRYRRFTQITPSNVTTYIANAAIGNAQIGGDIYSDLWPNSWGAQGWYLQRHGNLYCGNAYVRGDVEASSLKANTAMVNRANIVDAAVDTLQIAGNAVTIPASAEASGAANVVANTGSVNFQGAPVSLVLSASARDKINSGSTLAYMRLRRNGVVIKVVEMGPWQNSVGTSRCVVLIDNPTGTVYYQLDVVTENQGSLPGVASVYVGILANGIRR